MKKEYLILLALILILGAYLLLHKENKDNYTLPEINKIPISDITGLILEKKDEQIKFTKKEGKWVLTDKAYRAESGAVQNMLDALKTLRLSALVSQTSDLRRYELDPENRIQVSIIKGQNAVFNFTIGKTAPTANHTFVMLAHDKNIYHANGSFKSYFNKSIDGFRDKTVLEFKEASIKHFTIEKDGMTKTLFQKQNKNETDKNKASITWQSEDGTPVDNDAAKKLLAMISFLGCDTYLSSEAKSEMEKEMPLCRIQLKNGKNMELKVFSTEKQEDFNGISSMNTYGFTLSPFNGKEIITHIEKLLGIAQEEKEKEKE